ncbi:MAG: tetratricopeptide repeat protein, partial [Candidatus Sulfotelmatobacter sp.]
MFTTPSSAQGGSASKPSARFSQLSADADAARDAERLDEAVILYRRALALRPSWAEGWWSLGTIHYDRDAHDKAAIAFQKLIALQPENGTAQAMLGLCEFELNHPESALKHIEKGKSLGLQKNPDLWHVVLYHEGILLQRKSSFQAAQDTLEELCLQNGVSDPVANVLGMTMLRMSSSNPPAAASTDADVVLRAGWAECLAGQKKYGEARAAYEA